MTKTEAIVRAERIESRILLIRGHKVMLDSDLAELYGVATKALVQATNRNKERFPQDFMFQLSAQEFKSLRSQTVSSNRGRGGRRYAPYAFTEQGVAMLSSVLRSKRAILVNIQIMRAFVKLREILITHKELARKLAQLEKRIEGHDEEITAIFEAIRRLMEPPDKSSKRIGFHG
jgi:phage regulator Rha-like protein